MVKIPGGWIETTLGKCGNIITGKTPSTSNLDFRGGNTPFITPTDINESQRFCNPERNISDYGIDSFSSIIVPKNTICYTSIASIGLMCLTKQDSLTNQQINSLIVDENNDYLFFYYYLKYITPSIIKNAGGTTVPIINKSDFSKISVIIPQNPQEQKAIAGVLSSFDDKIELLRAENQTLEEMGQTLFKERFGKYKIGDELLDGWKWGELGEIGDQITERVKNEKERVVLSAVNSGNLVLSESYFSKQVFSEDIAKYITCDKGDFAYNPARINIGSIGRNFYWNGAVSPVYVVFRPKEKFGKYLEYIFKSERFKNHVEKYANGSVRQALNYDGFSRFGLLIPNKDILEKFNENLEVFEKKIEENKKQIETLSQTRDQLLPKLMSGEVRVEF